MSTYKLSCTIGTTDPTAMLGLEVWLDDLPIFNEQGERYEIASYRHIIEELESNLYLLPNNNVSGYLAPEIKEIDFFILSTLIMNSQDEKDFIRALNQIDIIQTAYAIDPYSLKSRDNFLIF